MSRDPHPGNPLTPATLNGYSYVHQNPVNLTDPSGLYVGPIDGYVEGFAASIAFPIFPGVQTPAFDPVDGNLLTVASGILNYLEKIIAIDPFRCLDGPSLFPRWVRRHQPLFSRELVYDFAHMQSARFAPQSLGAGGVDLTSDPLNFEIYLSLYAGPITGLASHDNIEGYTQNATNSAGGGLSAPTSLFAKHLTFSLGGAVNTNSAKQPNSLEALRNLWRDILRADKSTEVTSLVMGGSVGWTVKPSYSSSGKVGSGGNIGWITSTFMEPGSLTSYTNPPGAKPGLGEIGAMARDITTGIRYQTLWTDFWNKRDEILTISGSNLSYGSPLGLTIPGSLIAGPRLSAAENLFGYYAPSVWGN